MRHHLFLIHRTWRRLVIATLLRCLLLINLFTSSRARAHWIGCHKRRRRPERALFVVLFLTAMVLLEPHEYILWSIALGSALTFFLLVITVYRFLPRKRAHWVRS